MFDIFATTVAAVLTSTSRSAVPELPDRTSAMTANPEKAATNEAIFGGAVTRLAA